MRYTQRLAQWFMLLRQFKAHLRVLEWIAKAAKPLLWVAGVVTAISIMYAEHKSK